MSSNMSDTPGTPYIDPVPPPQGSASPTMSPQHPMMMPAVPTTPNEPTRLPTSTTGSIPYSPVMHSAPSTRTPPSYAPSYRTPQDVNPTPQADFGKDAFVHGFTHVLRYSTTSALYLTLQAIGFTDIHDLVLLTDKDIDNLATPTTSFGISDPSTLALMEPIKLPARKKLCQFVAWFFHINKRNNNAFNTIKDYLGLDHRMFDEYRTSGEYRPDKPILADKITPHTMPSTPSYLTSPLAIQSWNFRKHSRRT